MAYFEDNSPAMLELEGMVDKVGLRNVLYALSRICAGKADHIVESWQDRTTAAVWYAMSSKLDALAAKVRI